MNYFIQQGGQTIGPYDGNQIIDLLRSHQVSMSDLCSPEGMDYWQPLGNMIDPAQLAAPVAAPVAAPPAKRTTNALGCTALVLFLAVVVVVVIAKFGGSGTGDLGGQEERAPWNAGKGFVLKSLKAPSTAKFPGAYESNVGWQSAGADRWQVWGYVDSQNGFGAMIRNEWKAVVEKRGSDWYRLYLKLGDEEIGDRALWKKD